MPLTNKNLSIQIDPDHEEGIEIKLNDLIKVNPGANLQELKQAATLIHYAYLLTASEEGQQQSKSKEIVELLEMANHICVLDFLSIRLLGFHHLNEGNTASAKLMLTFFIDQFEKYKDNIPETNYASACFFRGISHFKEKNYGDAKEDFLSGMENDSEGVSLDTVAKDLVATYMTQLEEMEFKFTQAPLQKNIDHLKLVTEYREAKQYTKSLQHLDQAIILTPRSADLYLLRSNIAYEMRHSEEDVTALSFAIRARLYAAWLANAKIDETTKINGRLALAEGRELFKRLNKLHNMRKEMKEQVDKILNLQDGITSSKNKGEGIEITINLLPIIETIKKFLPKVKETTTLNNIAITLYHLHKDDLSKITKEECAKVHALVIKPSAIPKNILKKFENKIDALYKNGRKFEKIIKALDELMVEYPRFVSLHVERAKYLLIWGSPHHIQEARKSLETAYWIYRSKLDTHSPGLRSYHLQMSTLYLREGQITHSMTQHNEVMRLTEKEGKKATRDQYLALIDEIIALNHRQKTRHPKLFLDWNKLSYMLKNTPEKLALIKEVEASLIAAADNQNEGPQPTAAVTSTQTETVANDPDTQQAAVTNNTSNNEAKEITQSAAATTSSSPSPTPETTQNTNEDTEAKKIADEKARARAEAKTAKDIEKAKRKAAKKARKTRRKERSENQNRAPEITSREDIANHDTTSDVESDASDVDIDAPMQTDTNSHTTEEPPKAPTENQSEQLISISPSIIALQADSKADENLGTQENTTAEAQTPQLIPQVRVTIALSEPNLSTDELSFTQLEKDQHKELVAQRKQIRIMEAKLIQQDDSSTKQQTTIAKLEEKLAALEAQNTQQLATLTEQKAEIDSLKMNNSVQSNLILGYVNFFQNQQAEMAARQNQHVAHPHAPYPVQYPRQNIPYSHNPHRFQATHQTGMPTIRMIPTNSGTHPNDSEAKYTGKNRGG